MLRIFDKSEQKIVTQIFYAANEGIWLNYDLYEESKNPQPIFKNEKEYYEFLKDLIIYCHHSHFAWINSCNTLKEKTYAIEFLSQIIYNNLKILQNLSLVSDNYLKNKFCKSTIQLCSLAQVSQKRFDSYHFFL